LAWFSGQEDQQLSIQGMEAASRQKWDVRLDPLCSLKKEEDETEKTVQSSIVTACT
jgi:hypothetical protein